MKNKSILEISIFQVMIRYVCGLLLFIYNKGVIASGIFWIIVCVLSNLIINSYEFSCVLGLQHRVTRSLFFTGVADFEFCFYEAVICFSVVLYVILCINHSEEEVKKHFFQGAWYYAIIMVLIFFFIPAV
ncbi:MAG: hypothetical protein LBJ00_13130 [Planctomycetaceae bacterium]|jgi:hypothetical protein|nr:hypothetical protein [Planctomycetaceae bacterium]